MRFNIMALLLMAVTSSYAANSIAGISADGSKTQYLIDQVRSIKLTPQSSDDKGYRTIVFNDKGEKTNNQLSTSQEISVLVYPNPVSEYLTVTGVEDEVLKVFDINGNEQLSTKGSHVDVANLPTGEYILSVKGKSVKFIKK